MTYNRKFLVRLAGAEKAAPKLRSSAAGCIVSVDGQAERAARLPLIWVDPRDVTICFVAPAQTLDQWS